MVEITNLLDVRLKRRNPRSQEECCLIAARQCVAALGPMTTNDEIKGAARGIALGLFGLAYENADLKQARAWVAMAERAYRRAISEGGAA